MAEPKRFEEEIKPYYTTRPTWSLFHAQSKIAGVMHDLGLQFFSRSIGGTGIVLEQYKNTWQRKRETGFLIEIRYVLDNKRIYKRTEPWVNYPSDLLIAQLTLLPREVTKDV